MRYKLFALTVLLLFLSISIVYGRYSLSIPFHIDTGGLPVGSATVHINISESASCKTPFYLNKTTAKHGVGQFNVTSSRFVASRNYYYCFNATAGSSTIFGGPIVFQPGVGDINVSRWVNGSSSRFNTYQLNNGSIFDVIYGRQDGNVTLAGITNIIYNGTGIKLIQVYNSTLIKQITAYNNTLLKLTQGFNGTLLRLVNAYNSTLIKRITVYNGTLAKISQVYNGTLLKTFNNSNRGKLYFNNTIYSTGNIVAKFVMFNGSAFDVIYGRTNQTLPSSVLRNNTARGKLYFNNSIFSTGAIRASFLLLNGSNFDVIYGRDTTGSFVNGTAINSSGVFANNFFFGNGTSIKSIFVSEDTSNKTWPNVRLIYNNTDILGKFFINSSIIFNDTVTAYQFKLDNGSIFDVIYGRDTTGSFVNGTAINSSGIFANNFFFGNGTSIKSIFVSEDTSNKTWPNVRLIYNNTDIPGKFFINSSIIFNDTVTAYSFKLDNGSIFDVVYGRTGSGLSNGSTINGSKIWGNDIFFGNGTSIKSIFVSEDTSNKTWPNVRLIYNNTDIPGKFFINSSIIFNDTVTAYSFKLDNGSIFDVVYGRTGSGLSNGSTINGSKIWGNDILFGNLTSIKTLFAGYTNVTASQGLIISIKNNTARGKLYFNNSIFSTGAIRASFLLLNGSTFDVIYGARTNQTLAAGVLKNNTFSRLQYQRINATNITTKYNLIYNRTEPLANNSRWIGTPLRWFQRGFFQNLFIKRRCYTVDCSKYEEWNGTHVVKFV